MNVVRRNVIRGAGSILALGSITRPGKAREPSQLTIELILPPSQIPAGSTFSVEGRVISDGSGVEENADVVATIASSADKTTTNNFGRFTVELTAPNQLGHHVIRIRATKVGFLPGETTHSIEVVAN